MASFSALALTLGATAAQGQGTQNRGVQAGSVMLDWVPLISAGGGLSSVDRLMGRTVVGSDGERIGTITDVILGPDGQARHLVVRSGGFLGLGGRHVAVDIGQALTRPGGDSIRLHGMARTDIGAMPDFQYDDAVISLNRSPRRHDRAGQ
jgi:hypothetical protein